MTRGGWPLSTGRFGGPLGLAGGSPDFVMFP